MDKQYIDRQAVINLLYNVYSREVYTHEGTVQKVTGEIDINELNSIPAADVRENVKGEWVGVHAYCDYLNEEAKVNGKTQQYFPTGMVIGVYCNQCWCRADKKSDFCPNCGAYMGEKNE